ITGNTAKRNGGGVYAGYSYGDEGGPIEHRPDGNNTLTTLNCTIAFNTANHAGGGIFASDTLVNLFNTIVSDNMALGTLSDLDGTTDGLFNAQYSLVQTTNGMLNVLSTHNITGVSAQLLPLANNGGPTLTLRPKLTSPVLRAGSLSLLTPDMTTDQRGGPRTAFGTVDIGAVEIVPNYVMRRGWGVFIYPT
ncbi:MAG TPA: choice-of-anchor Q domain-containing protein, partial [Gemmataceae bacterium]|nr:choice-of-anchor Q domain-containing protein [Gemmataceae bacterium]